jgi:predicted protein tyrosine phosphatase
LPDIVHKLHNALSSAILLLGLMLAVEQDEEEREEKLRRIQTSLSRTRDLISMLEEVVESQE